MTHIDRGECFSCYYRHCCSREISFDEKCEHWKVGKCYTCKFVDETDQNKWLERGCEAECFGGCKKYKRDWKKTFELLKRRWKNDL